MKLFFRKLTLMVLMPVFWMFRMIDFGEMRTCYRMLLKDQES